MHQCICTFKNKACPLACSCPLTDVEFIRVTTCHRPRITGDRVRTQCTHTCCFYTTTTTVDIGLASKAFNSTVQVHVPRSIGP